VDWDAVIDLAGQHGLTGFVYAGLTAHGKDLVPVYYPEDKDLVPAKLLGKEIQTLSPEEMLTPLYRVIPSSAPSACSAAGSSSAGSRPA